MSRTDFWPRQAGPRDTASFCFFIICPSFHFSGVRVQATATRTPLAPLWAAHSLLVWPSGDRGGTSLHSGLSLQ